MDELDTFYAVKRGHKPGIYTKWSECEEAIKDFKDGRYRKFSNLKAAQIFLGETSLKLEITDMTPVSTFTLPTSTARVGSMAKSLSTECSCVCTCEKFPGISLPLAKFVEKSQSDLLFPHKSRFEAKNRIYRRLKKMKFVKAVNKDLLLDDNQFLDEDSHVIYTDGVCDKNGSAGAKGGIGVYWGPNHPKNVSEPLKGQQTKKRAEIMAAVKALHQCKSFGKKNVSIYTDSKFLITGITRWILKWKQNGCKLINGNNLKDFEMLDEARQGLNVKWLYVRPNSKNIGKEAAERLARNGVAG